MTKKVATLHKVSKTYGKEDLIVKALDNVNLEIFKGDYLAVMLSLIHISEPTRP